MTESGCFGELKCTPRFLDKERASCGENPNEFIKYETVKDWCFPSSGLSSCISDPMNDNDEYDVLKGDAF